MKTSPRVNIRTYSHDYGDDGDDDEHVVDVDVLGDDVFFLLMLLLTIHR